MGDINVMGATLCEIIDNLNRLPQMDDKQTCTLDNLVKSYQDMAKIHHEHLHCLREIV
mgnify:CR=1 FL=1